MADIPSDLKQLYVLLNLSPTASLEELDRTYFRLKAEKISKNLRQDIPPLKAAYRTIKAHLEEQLIASKGAPGLLPNGGNRCNELHHSLRLTIAQPLQAIYQGSGINVQVQISGRQLQIQLSDGKSLDDGKRSGSRPHAKSSRLHNQSKIVTQLHTWLNNNVSQIPGLRDLQTVHIRVFRASFPPLWSQTIPMPGAESTFADHDLTSFQSRLVQLFGFPGLLVVAIAMNTVPPIKFLLRGVTIWFHEFGHATVAWLSGRRALPLPLGWTNVEPTKSLFVYGGFLILFGLMGWAGYREQRRWPIVLAIALAILQFCMTWLMSTRTFEMLLAFGGIGGEFYLCTLLIVSFFFPLPHYFRWDLYRYPAVVGAAFTFFGSFSLWQQIDRGRQSIPWGSLWGGADHQGGDMNQLSHVFGWSDQTIIDTYNTLGGLCLSTMIGVYLYFVWKNQRSHLVLFWHQCKASYWK